MKDSASLLDRVRHQAGKVAAQWRGAPPIAVVATPGELPVPAPADARGVFVGGTVWVVSDTQRPADVARTLGHEVIAHHGLRQALGPAWRDFMGAVQAGVHAGDVHLHDLRQEVRWGYQGMNLSRAAEADEMAAGLVERGMNSRTGRFEPERPIAKRAAAALAHFKRESLYFDEPATYDQVEGSLLAAEHFVRHGGRWWGLGARFRDWYAAQMPQKWDVHKPPMSLDESERLLAAERHRDDNGIVRQFLLAGLLLLGGICGVVYLVVNWLVR